MLAEMHDALFWYVSIECAFLIVCMVQTTTLEFLVLPAPLCLFISFTGEFLTVFHMWCLYLVTQTLFGLHRRFWILRQSAKLFLPAHKVSSVGASWLGIYIWFTESPPLPCRIIISWNLAQHGNPHGKHQRVFYLFIFLIHCLFSCVANHKIENTCRVISTCLYKVLSRWGGWAAALRPKSQSTTTKRSATGSVGP